MLNRQKAIVAEVESSGFVTIRDLASLFDVSEMSIRRDAEVLAQQGLVRRIRGGLIRADVSAQDAETTPAVPNEGWKKAIAQRAAADVGGGDVIVIDAGSTCYEFAQALPMTFHGTVISHSLPILNAMLDRPLVTTIGLGGELFRRSQAFVGSSAIRAAGDLRASVCYMGAAAIDGHGIYSRMDTEKEVKRALMKISRRIVMLVDHTKFEVAAPVFLSGWGDGFTIITDQPPVGDNLSMLKSAGVHVVVAGDEPVSAN